MITFADPSTILPIDKHIDELTCDSFIDIAEQNSEITELQRQLENDQIDDDSSDEDVGKEVVVAKPQENMFISC